MEVVTGFTQLLENGAMGLKKEGSFTTEFTARDLDGLMRSILEESKAEMKKKGVAAQINTLKVAIENGMGSVATEITATKKVVLVNIPADISASFGLENEPDAEGKPSGRLKTTRLEVIPETLFGVINPKDFLAPYVEGGNINNTFKNAMDTEMGKRGARVSSLSLAFTPENKLKITAKGSSK